MSKHHYIESGLDDVWLLNGFKIEKFAGYGEAVAIQNERRLWQLLGRNIARQDRPMNGQELRFLRTLLDWSQAELGRRLGYADHQMVARWEKHRHDAIPVQADLLMRACYLESIREKVSLLRVSQRLAELADAPAAPPRARVLRRNAAGDWEARELPPEMELARRIAPRSRASMARKAA